MATTRARTTATRKAPIPQKSGALTPVQRRELEVELLAEQARLGRSLGAAPVVHLDPLVRESYGSVPGGDPDGGLRIALHGRVNARYEAIGAALRRLADGTYGRCIGCGEFIPFGRLLVMPESERCMTCSRLA